MRNRKIVQKRLWILAVFFSAAIAGLCIRIAVLQIYDDDTLAVMASGQYLEQIDEAVQRAGIYDRNGVEITGGEKSVYYYIKSSELEEKGKKLLEEYGCEEVGEHNGRYSIWKGAENSRQTAALEAEYDAFSVKYQERYDDDQSAVHLIGYVSGAGKNGEEGQCGLEKMYEERLKKGSLTRYFYRDAKGNYLNGLGVLSDSEITEEFRTTLDLDLQREVEQILEENGNAGGIVIASAKTGEILAYASFPSYNPNQVGDYLSSEKKELTDRVSGAAYPPGSVFKLVVAAAALEAGIADENSEFECRGSIDVGGITVRCSTGGESGHGRITLKQALAQSCNCAFIELGIKTGGERILQMAEAMGFGSDICAEISENAGNLPQSSLECGIANLSIGQGTVLATPLQVTAVMKCIAGGGFSPALHVLTDDTWSDLEKYDLLPESDEEAGVNMEEAERALKKQVEGQYGTVDGKDEGQRVLSQQTARALLDMMCETTASGTAKNLSEYTDYSSGGKTGSAQSSMSGERVVHGWYSGFYPQNDPEFAVTVFMENGGGGSSCIAAAGKIIDYLGRNQDGILDR